MRLIARRIHDRLPESVSLDDLISTGMVGLISAIDRFDPSQNVKLKTYAEYKIRGAILDSLRGLDWAPRQQRKRAKQIEAAICAAEQRLHRSPYGRGNRRPNWARPSRSITAGWWIRAGLTWAALKASPSGRRKSADLLKYRRRRRRSSGHRALVERSELQKLLAEAIAKMPDIEKTVLSLYYHEELTLREISKIVHLHESRISQLKSQAILRLRSYMEKRWPDASGR